MLLSTSSSVLVGLVVLIAFAHNDAFVLQNHVHQRSINPNRAELFVIKHAKATSEAKDHLSHESKASCIGRHEFLSQQACALASFGAAVASSFSSPQKVRAATEEGEEKPQGQEEEGGIIVYKTKSGLKYIELQPGTGPSPRYGQLCSIQYTGYMKLPNDSKPQKFDSNIFLTKHGNGRIIAGLDEGLHTMQVGGKRRLIIPPKLGYVQSGLGPIPELPWNRWSLNNLLDQMIEQRGGNLVFEVELKSVIDDEADQGYYEDLSPSPEEFERLKLRFQDRSAAAATAQDAAQNSNL